MSGATDDPRRQIVDSVLDEMGFVAYSPDNSIVTSAVLAALDAFMDSPEIRAEMIDAGTDAYLVTLADEYDQEGEMHAPSFAAALTAALSCVRGTRGNE